MSDTSVSIIIPVLNEAERIEHLLASLPAGVEIIVVDGGSRDGSALKAAQFGARVVHSARGRALQMNAGAAVASGDILLFLHADTELPGDFLYDLRLFSLSRHAWGRFDVRIGGDNPLFRLVERMMNLRAALTGVCTGDQAMFVRRQIFVELDGFPPIPLMEDIALSKNLRRITKPFVIKRQVRTSPRRWHEGGILATILLMWRLRLAYFLGAPPERLVERYYR